MSSAERIKCWLSTMEIEWFFSEGGLILMSFLDLDRDVFFERRRDKKDVYFLKIVTAI